MSEKYKSHEKDKAYFVTFTIVRWIDVLKDDYYKMIIVNAVKFYQQNRGLLVYAYCIMPNHVHMIIQSNGDETVSEVLRDLKKFTSVEIIKKLKSENAEFNSHALTVFKAEANTIKRNKNYKVWQDGNHPMVLYGNKFIRQKLNYIHNNPVKAGIVEKAEDYLFCSTRNYAELSYVLECIPISGEVITIK
jgi:REP element-mobilizing transposase RayT